jgi:peptide/nickel transport system substrate-binding protein
VEGPYAGTIILKHAFAPIMASTLPVMSGKVLPEKAVTALGKKFATNPVGSGPYEFSSWVPGQHVVLNRFHRYSGANRAYAPRSQWATIETQVVSSDATALEAMATGSIDYGYLGISTVAKAKATSSVKVVTKPGQSFNFLALNVTDPVLRNKNLRYAIRSAIDVPGILKAAYYDLYPRAYGIIPPSMKVGYWPNAPRYNKDIPLAKKYLAKSGLSKVSLRLNLLNDQTDQNACQIIAANLAEIGINVSLDPQDSATYYAIPGNGGGGTHRQLNYVGYTTEPDPYWSYIWFTCAQIGLWNWSDWCNHTFTSLLNQAVRTYDNAKREQLYVQADKLWDAEAAMVWICYNGGSYAFAPTIRPCIRPDSIPVLWNTAAS